MVAISHTTHIISVSRNRVVVMEHLLAAVDIGSNSFRLSIGRVEQTDGLRQIYQIDKLKETVRLAAGLDENKILSEDAIERALEVLHRFGDRLRSFDPDRVRAVATNTFRVARNTPQFLPRAEAALGFPIEVIAGREEARLIYTGVSQTLPASDDHRLVIDIGGGSTEAVIGQRDTPVLTASLYMGCVSYSRRFFPDGQIDADRMQAAITCARREIEIITKPYCRLGWQQAYGSSGSSKALYAILTEGGLSEHGITLEGLHRLKDKLISAGRVIVEVLPGIKSHRADVLPGGLAIMTGFFEELQIDRMRTGDGALRLGVLVDLAGRESFRDRRDETVKAFMKRYRVESRQAARVKRACLSLYDSIAIQDDIDDDLRHFLSWASDLHEAGLSIAQSGYHKHGAYILTHADMPGFSKVDQDLLAMLVLAHHGKLSKITNKIRHDRQWKAILALRLATLLCRRREEINRLTLSVTFQDKHIITKVDRLWLQDHPLAHYSLQTEQQEWEKAGFTFELIACP